MPLPKISIECNQVLNISTSNINIETKLNHQWYHILYLTGLIYCFGILKLYY